jgi:hypothetical protein
MKKSGSLRGVVAPDLPLKLVDLEMVEVPQIKTLLVTSSTIERVATISF